MTPNAGMEIHPIPPDEIDALSAIMSQSLRVETQPIKASVLAYGVENNLGLYERGRLIGGLGMVKMGQFFGGARVPMGGIANVAIAPDCRGRGGATLLLKAALDHFHGAGFYLSSLFPSSVRVYRKMGYERAGSRRRYEIPIGDLTSARSSYRITPIDKHKDREDLIRLHEQRARKDAGLLDRHPYLWDDLLCSTERKVEGYRIHGDGRAEGYVFYSNRRGQPLQVHDICASNQEAASVLLTFLAGHRGQVESVVFPAGPQDPLLHGLEEQRRKMIEDLDWMTRIVDVASALEARGYPLGIETEIAFEIDDPFLPWNSGRYVLEVAGGGAAVRKGGKGGLRLGPRGLAALFTGHRVPAQLEWMGLLETGEGQESDRDRAALAFSGPAPWMAVHF